MGRARNRELELLSLLGYIAWLTVGHSRADGGVFLLDLENGSKGGHETGFEAATNACMAQGAQVASKEDLHHAVLECAFSACSRGWLSGPSIGTTVCSGVQGNLRTVDVQVENVTSDIEWLGVFCVKDSDSPCGQPPSFPNSHLQGKTGLDLGDELLYACNQGYKLPDGQMAFSLVCDSCGEWYGLSHCVKDDPEGHIDYEDKFTDPREVHDGGATETIDHEADEPTSEPEHERTIISKENDDLTVLATESSVSQISQKHMFWFPSEGFQVPGEPSVIITDSSVKNPTEDQSHMTDKTSDHQTPAKVITEGHDPDYDQTTDPPTDDPVSPSVGSTEDSWIDGYPVSQGEDKVRGVSTVEAVPEPALEVETVTGSPDVEVFEDTTKSFVEEETGGYIDSSVEEPIEGVNNNPEDVKYKKVIHTKEGGTTRPEKQEPVGVKDGPYYEEPSKGLTEDDMKKKIYAPKSELDGVTETPNAVHMRPTTFVRLTTSKSSADDNIAIHKKPMIYTPAYAPENVSTSQEGLDSEHATTPSGMGLMDSTPVFVDDITNMPTPIIKVSWETNDSDHFLAHVPVHEILDDQNEIERDGDQTLDHQEGEGACAEDPCRAFGRGPMVAAIIIGIAAAVLGVVVAVWCYKRRQQKSSHYQLNGTNTQTQCIELQQTV
nr:uncharacterized protein susd5 [Misgurnus anguillicaudatus]